MPPHPFAALKQARADLRAAQSELDALRQSISHTDALVGSCLGSLLDELSALEVEVENLTQQVLQIRDQCLYGEHQMQYTEGAPRPERTSRREYIPNQDVFDEPASAAPQTRNQPLDDKAELKRLYRRLARIYHPDLSVKDSQRAQRNRQMVLINQAYSAADLSTLRRLWQEEGLEPIAVQPPPALEQTELERLQSQLDTIRPQIFRLKNHPHIQLSLDIKMARRAGRDLLGEMALDMRRKIARKAAERDYLRSQIAHQV
jgi:hypothetical protein